MIVKFINPTAVITMMAEQNPTQTQTTNLKDGKPLPIEILNDLINAREELEGIYNTVKRVMAYVQNNDMYTTLEEVRKALINVIQLMNQAIDLTDPYEVEVVEA